MLKIHDNDYDLNESLKRTDTTQIEGKRAKHHAVIFLLRETPYNTKIPIISENELERWTKSNRDDDSQNYDDADDEEDVYESTSERYNGSSQEAIDDDVSIRDKEDKSQDTDYLQCHSNSDKSNNIINGKNGRSYEFVNDVRAIDEDGDFIGDSSADESKENSNDGTYGRNQPMWIGDDELVIRESNFVDEFKGFSSDGGDSESEMTKNLKKIRSAPIAKQPPPPSQPNTSKPKQTHKSPTKPSSVTKLPEPAKNPDPPPPPPDLPDWPDIEKSLKSNNFNFVYRDLAHFKSHIPSSPQAIQLLHESAIKLCQEDETTYLRQILELMIEMNLTNNNTIEFWAELVPRIKRKLSAGTKYKTKVDSKIIFQNYERILASVREYIAFRNLTLKLPYGTMQWFINYGIIKQEQKPDVTKLIPLQTSDRFLLNLPDIKQKIKEEPDRKVTMVNSEPGKTTFKISKVKKEPKPFRFRL